MSRNLARLRSLPIVLALCLPAPARAALSDGWTVLAHAVPDTANLVANPGFESGPAGGADGWTGFAAGYAIDGAGAHGGTRSLLLTNVTRSDQHGAYQAITLNQATPRAVTVSAWSRATAVSGDAGPDDALYMDVFYTDGSALYAQVVTFATGTHDWERHERTLVPPKPIATIWLYALLRGGHTGSVRYDDVDVRQYADTVRFFDGVPVTPAASPPVTSGVPTLTASTGDGLVLALTQDGGAVPSLVLDGTELVPAGRGYTGGLLVRDVAAGSDVVHAGGHVALNAGTLTQTDAGANLGLALSLTLTPRAGVIDIAGTVTDLTATDRALTVYVALPLDAAGWAWGDDLRHDRVVSGTAEFRNTTLDGFQDGPLSRYPFAAVTGRVTGPAQAGGLSLAYALDVPQQVRLVLNPDSRQFYLAFDLALTANTKTPRAAAFGGALFRHAARWPFDGAPGSALRAAAEKFYALFPQWFTRRANPAGEGIWIAFTDLSTIPNVLDFGVAYHEADTWAVPFDDALGVATLRYVSEPYSYHMPITNPAVDPNDYDQVLAYLTDRYQHGTGRDQEMAEATLSSASGDSGGHLRFTPESVPWCNAGGPCVVFTMNPDPDVSVPPYTVNKAQTDWNAAVLAAYTTTPTLDGEYVDSFLTRAEVPDFRRDHFSAAAAPLAPAPAPGWTAPVQTGSHAVRDFAQRIAGDVHARGKLTMANTILLDVPWGADLFDVAGTEVNWTSGGAWAPPADTWFLYKRALMDQKPYGTLMNMDFTQLTAARSEQYMQTSLFYGIYASMFSADAFGSAYWEQPALYERDRPLFKKYVPLARTLNLAGWQPVTHATSSSAFVYVERFGGGDPTYLAVRNDSGAPANATVTVDTAALGLLAAGRLDVRELVLGTAQTVDYGAGSAPIPVSLGAQGVAVLKLRQAAPPPVPDGRGVPGTELRVAKSGANVTVTWDASRCTPANTHLAWYDLAHVATYTIKAVTCAAGNTGSWTGAAPAGHVAVLAVADDGATLEGSYGVDSRGLERPSSTPLCGLTAKRTDGTCP